MEVKIYDTTLRDGTQAEDFCFSADDKVRIALKLDDIGIHYIEGGWPGSNPKDAEFFREIQQLSPKAGQNCGFRLNSPSRFDRCLRSQPQGAARSKYRTGYDFRKKLDGACKRSPAHDPRAQPRAHFRQHRLSAAAGQNRLLRRRTFLRWIQRGPAIRAGHRWKGRSRPALSASFCATPTEGPCPVDIQPGYRSRQGEVPRYSIRNSRSQ